MTFTDMVSELKEENAMAEHTVSEIIADGLEALDDGQGFGAEHMKAQLLADAAPDLLAACKLAVIELGYVKHAEAESNALVDLREAIRNAEGGS